MSVTFQSNSPSIRRLRSFPFTRRLFSTAFSLSLREAIVISVSFSNPSTQGPLSGCTFFVSSQKCAGIVVRNVLELLLDLICMQVYTRQRLPKLNPYFQLKIHLHHPYALATLVHLFGSVQTLSIKQKAESFRGLLL